ncbi:MAG: hypothetical protein H3C30_07270 [Candidatus Hydrogenedentes bacterium]|nr:hypothetical protein [Candidatus Hydrogenedentota bacterium]
MMAVWSEVDTAVLSRTRRLDAEYYQPWYLEIVARIRERANGTLGDFALPRKRKFKPSPGSAFNYIDISSVSTTNGEWHSQCLEDSEAPTRAQFKVDNDTILLSTVRPIRSATALLNDIQPRTVCSSGFLPLRAIGMSPEFLFAFLKSEVIISLLDRETTATMYPAVAEEDVLSLPFVRPSVSTEAAVTQMVRECRSSLEESKRLYAAAEGLLSSALGLDGLDLTARLYYERPYADLEAAARFDAEYFSPRTQNLLAALSRDGLTLGDVAKLAKRRFKPKPGVAFQYIEIADVTGNGTVEASPVAGGEAPSRATWIVKPGDVITSTVRPIRRLSAIIADDQGGHVCSSGFAVLTPLDIAPELLLVFLRIPLICELLDLHTTASMYPAISTADLMKIPIALPGDETPTAIVSKVRESFVARREARRLLDEAKRMVEEVILGESCCEADKDNGDAKAPE